MLNEIFTRSKAEFCQFDQGRERLRGLVFTYCFRTLEQLKAMPETYSDPQAVVFHRGGRKNGVPRDPIYHSEAIKSGVGWEVVVLYIFDGEDC